MVKIRIMTGRVMLLCLALMLVWQVSAVYAADQGTGAAGFSYQKEVLATVGAIEGDATVQRAGEAKFKRILVKSPLYRLDYLATGKQSKVWWKGAFNAYSRSGDWQPAPELTHGSLGADSIFGFKQLERAGASYRFIGNVPKGSVRFIKTLPNTNPPSSFTIATRTAWIEVLPSDRAADFIVQSINESLTTVTVLWGKIRVKNISPEIKESRVLTSCQEVDVERDAEPSPIRWVSTDTMTKLVKRTTIPKTLPEDVPSCERLKTEVLLDVTAVFLPPPGVALFPVVPVPVPGDKEECCPPGQTYDPRTGKCGCPCPEGERPPVRALGGNGAAVVGQCMSCRDGARFNPQTCSCECPCPQGQFLLPGEGCVPQCPPRFTVNRDVSSAPPYGCPVCQDGTGIVVDPPPLVSCQNDAQCDCGECFNGFCFPKRCEQGFFLDRQTCRCESASNLASQPCGEDSQCPQCQRCDIAKGFCRRDAACREQMRLNLDTCQCESLNGTELVHPRALTEEPTGCQHNSDCPEGQVCRGGKCVKKPPVSQPLGGTETFTQPFVEDPSIQQLRREQTLTPTGPGFGIGGDTGQRVAPVQRVPRKAPRSKPN